MPNHDARFSRDEIRSRRQQRAAKLGPSDANHLRLVAHEVEDLHGLLELPGVDAERLRLLARQLEHEPHEIEQLRQHATRIHRALCDAIDDEDRANAPALFVFVMGDTAHAGLTPAQFCELATYLLDEAE